MKEGRSGHTTAYTVVTHDPRDREPVRPSGGAPECLLACETLCRPSGRPLTGGCASTALNDTGFEAHIHL